MQTPLQHFDPTSHSLDPNFALLDFVTRKGWGCKIPQDELISLLTKTVGKEITTLDTSIIQHKKYKELYQISSIDFFFPIVNDPYYMGKIACANVLSDMYATGVTDIDNILMVLTNSTKMNAKQNDVIIPMLMRGFIDSAKEGFTSVTGGQTVKNNEIIIGGVAMSICKSNDFINPIHAKNGDVIILTKPIGTRIAVNAYQWLSNSKRKRGNVSEYNAMTQHLGYSDEQIMNLYYDAMVSMSELNYSAALLMKKYKAHCATDITGFGLKGHAKNLLQNQEEKVDFIFEKIPIFRNSLKLVKTFGPPYHFFTAPETSGGLLICVEEQYAKSFLKEFEELTKRKAYVIGKVVDGNHDVKFKGTMDEICFDVDY